MKLCEKWFHRFINYLEFTDFGCLDKVLLFTTQYFLPKFHDGTFGFMKEMQFKGQRYFFICFLIMTLNNIYSLFLGKVPGRAFLLLQIIPIGWSYEYETSFYYLVSQKFSDSIFWLKILNFNAWMNKTNYQSSNNLFWRSIHEGSFMRFKRF